MGLSSKTAASSTSFDHTRLRDRGEPSAIEVAGMMVVAMAIHLLIFTQAVSYWPSVSTAWIDNVDYLQIADAIDRGQWHCLPACPPHAWGFPFAIVFVSSLLRIPHVVALVAISAVASVAASVLAHRLYGGWAAAASVAIGYTWIQLSAHGGSEPLFMCALYASFLYVRRGNVRAGALLAALAATVRPLGAIAAGALFVDALRRRDRADIAALVAITAGVATLYVAWVMALTGDPLAAGVRGYQGDWYAGFPFTIPLATIVAGVDRFSVYPRQMLITYVWVAVVISAAVALCRRTYPQLHFVERLFAVVYITFFISSRYEGMVDWFLRFMVPIAPIVAYALQGWIPRRRWVLWLLTMLSGTVGAGSTLIMR
jgi:hypothetical protein